MTSRANEETSPYKAHSITELIAILNMILNLLLGEIARDFKN